MQIGVGSVSVNVVARRKRPPFRKEVKKAMTTTKTVQSRMSWDCRRLGWSDDADPTQFSGFGRGKTVNLVAALTISSEENGAIEHIAGTSC